MKVLLCVKLCTVFFWLRTKKSLQISPVLETEILDNRDLLQKIFLSQEGRLPPSALFAKIFFSLN